jgi:hypothetical protein
MIHPPVEAPKLSYEFATMAYGNTVHFVPMTWFRRLCVLNTESGHGRFHHSHMSTSPVLEIRMNDKGAAASAERGDESGARSLPVTRLFDRRPTLDQMNLLFSGVVLGWAGVVGSVVSVLFSGAILLAFLRLYQRKIVFPSDRAILAIALAFAFYLAADVISGLFHNDGMVTWRQVAKDIPFLGFAFVYARLSLSRREDALDAVERGAILGAFATILVIGAELIFTAHDRAEGLAGNPGVLAVISSLVYGICLLAAVRHEILPHLPPPPRCCSPACARSGRSC